MNIEHAKARGFNPAVRVAPFWITLRCASRSSRARGSAAKARGFTLLEVVLAFSVLALGLALAMRGATDSMRNARLAEEQTRAALHAQSILDVAGVGERLQVGRSHGEFDDGIHWQLEVTPFEDPADAEVSGLEPALAPVQLMQLELVLSWRREERTVEARYRTLRALLPQNG